MNFIPSSSIWKILPHCTLTYTVNLVSYTRSLVLICITLITNEFETIFFKQIFMEHLFFPFLELSICTSSSFICWNFSIFFYQFIWIIYLLRILIYCYDYWKDLFTSIISFLVFFMVLEKIQRIPFICSHYMVHNNTCLIKICWMM